MSILGQSLISFPFPPSLSLILHCRRNGSRQFKGIQAKKQSGGDTSQEPTFTLTKVSRTVVARSAVAVFALGFIDAGYSGDWSRIGAISKDTEAPIPDHRSGNSAYAHNLCACQFGAINRVFFPSLLTANQSWDIGCDIYQCLRDNLVLDSPLSVREMFRFTPIIVDYSVYRSK